MVFDASRMITFLGQFMILEVVNDLVHLIGFGIHLHGCVFLSDNLLRDDFDRDHLEKI